MNIILDHKTLGEDYPQIFKFFQVKCEELELDFATFAPILTQLDIYIMDGILFDAKGMCYGQLFDGNETRQDDLYLQRASQKIHFTVPLTKPAILLSNFGDDDFKRATIVHEISHLIKNMAVGITDSDHDEEIAQEHEQEFLQRGLSYQPEDLINYMYQKYLPKPKE
jgi:hypothetical protein